MPLSCRATPRMYDRSALPSSPGGVGKAKKMTWAWATAGARSVVNSRRPCLELRSKRISRPGSKMGTSPLRMRSTLAASMSTQMTWLPVSAKQVPVTKPTYPVPTTAIFMMRVVLRPQRYGYGGENATDVSTFRRMHIHCYRAQQLSGAGLRTEQEYVLNGIEGCAF